MPRLCNGGFPKKVKSLHESDVLPFHDIVDAEMVNSAWPWRASRSRSESTLRL